ncbi:SCO family protein [Reinekea sp.]|jgi:protein SCO1/2|uniref:SCO family protein n=1 Tax=Reinekea sp. TaxID=1970455 RepID=UPI002A81E5BC|nr:SCO family protein [Reinekea sp.]
MKTKIANSQRNRSIGWTVSLSLAVVALMVLAIVMKTLADRPTLKQQLELVNGVLFDTPRRVPDVTLMRHDGDVFTPAQWQGKWDLITFGFTYCPDVCPTNMADMNLAYQQLVALGLADRVRFWMVTVDPERDSVAQLSLYVPYYNAEFVGLTGADDQLSLLANQLSAVYFREGEGEGYTVAHSDNFAIVDPEGHLISLLRPPHKPSHITDALSLLMNSYGL